jgi:hypothetical protein
MSYGLTVSENYGMKHKKKSFSLNRLYLRNKSIHKEKDIKDSEVMISKEEVEEKQTTPLKSMSEKQFGFELS